MNHFPLLPRGLSTALGLVHVLQSKVEGPKDLRFRQVEGLSVPPDRWSYLPVFTHCCQGPMYRGLISGISCSLKHVKKIMGETDLKGPGRSILHDLRHNLTLRNPTSIVFGLIVTEFVYLQITRVCCSSLPTHDTPTPYRTGTAVPVSERDGRGDLKIREGERQESNHRNTGVLLDDVELRSTTTKVLFFPFPLSVTCTGRKSPLVL